MSKIRTEGLSPMARVLRTESATFNEAADCAVMAVAAATGEAYEKVWQLFVKTGRRPKHRTPMHFTERVLKQLGFQMRSVNPRDFINRYPGQHTLLRHVTTHHPDRFPAVWREGTYLFRTRGHILCVSDGVNHDHTRGHARRVRQIYRVEKVS